MTTTVILKRGEETLGWCGVCGKAIYAKEDLTRKDLAHYDGIPYIAIVCSECIKRPDVWDLFASRVRAWLRGFWEDKDATRP